MDVDWSHRGEYMRAKHGITVAWANEALADPDALVEVPDPASKSGVSDRTTGWSTGAGDLVVVITTNEEDGTTYGLNGWLANSTARRKYDNQKGSTA
ncbi:transposase [Gordonia liuliyuniae]|uniref:Transposase n=1 Tax=Gordonia liuliyuniae TaxID=2911517 RepID=A0ABS9IS56_9ACTN|nr:transposase [Gordonia liuliyuniae]MCF8588397.1 transposase [Gordonia liuliyuniae]